MPKFQVVPLVALAFTVAAGAALAIEDGNAISKPAGEGEAMTKAQDEQPLLDKSADAVPASTPGTLLALADRFDLLAAMFGQDEVPA